MTNKLTDALRAIDPEILLRAALRQVVGKAPLVFDSIRFRHDHEFFKANGFVLWQVTAPLSMCTARLAKRGQSFSVGVDDIHLSETETLLLPHDFTLTNTTMASNLYAQVDAQLAILK